MFAGCTPFLLDEDAVEDAVHPGEDAVDGAEVLDEPRVAAGQRAMAHRVVDGDVGAPEAVDRLLRVADDGQAARPRPQLEPVLARLVVARDAERDVGLHRVGVLELVDEDDREAAAEVVARLGALGEQVARPLEQVVEVRCSLGAALRLVAGDELLGEREAARRSPACAAPPSPRRARSRTCFRSAFDSAQRGGSSQSSFRPRGRAAACGAR